jgi:hypothetical protein
MDDDSENMDNNENRGEEVQVLDDPALELDREWTA